MSLTKNQIYLSSPHMGGSEQKYVDEAFESNWIAPLGPNVDAFEKTLAEYCGVGHAAALSSGTAAIHLALILLGVKAGDEVIVPSFTFSASVNPIVYQGAKPVFIDSEKDTWNMDPELLEQAIMERKLKSSEKRLKAIIVVHLYGMPAKMDKIMEIANRYDISVIEDAAEALGSKYKGKPLGSFGEMAVLSFNGNKIITTSGGGALISNDKELIERSRFLATQARDKAPHYQHSSIGYNYRMSNVLAGIGRGQMEVIDKRVAERRKINQWYCELLRNVPGITFHKEPSDNYFSNFWLTCVVIDSKLAGIEKEHLRLAMEVNMIESRSLWKPMHMQPVFSKYQVFDNGVSERLFNDGLCLPSGSNLTENDLERISDVLSKELSLY